MSSFTPTTPTPTTTSSSTSSPHVVRTTGDGVRAFPAALRSEWIKLSSLRVNRAILALTIACGAFVSWAVAVLVHDEVLVVSDVYVFSTFLTGTFAAVGGILLFSSEAQHGTLAGTLTAVPSRWVVVAAKAVMAAARGLVLGAAGMASGFVGAVAGGLALGDTSGMIATTLWSLLFTVLAALLGLGVGMVVRHSSGAISGLLVWWLVVENLLALFLDAGVVRFLPFVSGVSLLGIDSDTATPESIAVALTAGQNALVFGGYTALALAVGTLLLYRRDTN